MDLLVGSSQRWHIMTQYVPLHLWRAQLVNAILCPSRKVVDISLAGYQRQGESKSAAVVERSGTGRGANLGVLAALPPLG
jgi:hypothetical protein